MEVERTMLKGCPRKTQLDRIKKEMKRYGLSWEATQSRRKWRKTSSSAIAEAA